MKVEVDVLGSASLIVVKVSVDVKQHLKKKTTTTTATTVNNNNKTKSKLSIKVQEIWESRDGRPRLPFLTALMVSAHIKQHLMIMMMMLVSQFLNCNVRSNAQCHPRTVQT